MIDYSFSVVCESRIDSETVGGFVGTVSRYDGKRATIDHQITMQGRNLPSHNHIYETHDETK